MIRFQTLGAVEIRDAQGKVPGAVLRQPKRLALLAYLAVAVPRRFHRRDTLLGLFWPELDQEHARAALRRALYYLRTELGPEVITGRGDEEVAVPEDALWCDTTELESAMESGDPERALAQYRGTLLEGLHVAGAAPELQQWLDTERTRLRNRAAAAARQLSEGAEAAGRLDDSAAWALRLLQLVPEDEPALRRLVSLLDRAGDRPAALKAYDEFARRMREDLDTEPSAETRALVEIVRRRSTVPSPAAARIAILPFTVRGDPRFSYLREGMVDLLATRLDGAGAIRTMDVRAVLRAGVTEGRDAVERFGVAMYLAGTVVEAGGRLRASATLHAANGSALATVAGEAADEAGLFELVDDLARQILGTQGLAGGSRLARLAALTTESLDALKAYLRGEEHLRSGRYFDALEGFQWAVDQDATFALAYYRLAAAAAGCALPDVAREVADRGSAHRGRLSPHDQIVFSAQRAWLHGEVAEAESLYTTITGTYPDDVEAWFHLGDLLFHSNPLRGRTAAEARAPFERVTALEPEHLAATVHLVRIAAIEDRERELFALIDRALRISPHGDQALAMRALRAYRTRDAAVMSRLEEELQHARAVTVAIAFSDVALYSGNHEGAERLARRFIHVARAPELRALCHMLLACLTLADHRVDAAWKELELAEQLDPAWGLEMRALFATLRFLPTPPSRVRAIRDGLDRWDPSGVPASSFPLFAMHNGLHPAVRAWLLGLLDLRLGDVTGAMSRADALESHVSGGAHVARGLAAELRAAIARAQGKPAEALALLEGTSPVLWFQLTVASPFFSLASSRLLRAELLEEVGRRREAADWRRSLAQRSPYEIIYTAG